MCKDASTRSPAPADWVLLLVGHGSRQTAGNQEIQAFAQALRTRAPDWSVQVCFIEHAEVLLNAGLDLAAAHASRVVVLPLILNAAGHVKMEIPEAVTAARGRHPDVIFEVARHLGMGPEILTILKGRIAGLMQSLHAPDPRTTGVILLGRGSSDPGANGELARMARWVFEAHHHDLVDLAFTGVTWPRLESVVQRQVRLGMGQICIVPVYLFTGVLIQRIEAQVARLRAAYPQVAFALGRHFGFDEGIYGLVAERVAAVLGEASGTGLLECDGCKYRAQVEALEHGATDHLSHHCHAHQATPPTAGLALAGQP